MTELQLCGVTGTGSTGHHQGTCGNNLLGKQPGAFPQAVSPPQPPTTVPQQYLVLSPQPAQPQLPVSPFPTASSLTPRHHLGKMLGSTEGFQPFSSPEHCFPQTDSMLWGDSTESVSVCMDPMDPLLFPGQQPEHWDKQMLQGWDLSSLPGAEGPQGG